MPGFFYVHGWIVDRMEYRAGIVPYNPLHFLPEGQMYDAITLVSDLIHTDSLREWTQVSPPSKKAPPIPGRALLHGLKRPEEF